MDRQLDPEDIKREKRAERLRRTYEALGKEQNGIFESLAEYTHEVQAEVRSLLVARDRLLVEPAPGGGQGDDGPPVMRFGRPIILPERWMSVEVAAAGIVVCALLGAVLGIIGVRTPRWGGRSSRSPRKPHVHQD